MVKVSTPFFNPLAAAQDLEQCKWYQIAFLELIPLAIDLMCCWQDIMLLQHCFADTLKGLGR
eukprot:scaffold236852_cov51-Prasinocladus_malaysianus.AAC.2